MTSSRPAVAILGGGINGAAIARELSLSAVDVIVVEASDLACGATAWSTRLVHGGLRYLEYGEIELVRESLAERARLVRLAPHLVRPLSFYLPLERRRGGLLSAAARLVGYERLARWLGAGRSRGSWAVGIGLSLYDLLSGDGWPRHRIVRAAGFEQPEVDRRRFPLGATYTDAQMIFPERFTVELLLDAKRIADGHGSDFRVLTHRTTRSGAGGGLVIEPGSEALRAGVEEVLEFRPDAIVNASGAWVDRTRASVPLAADGPRLVGGTQGSHLVIASPSLATRLHGHGVYAEADDGRPVFVLPFTEGVVLVGTTDFPFMGDPADAIASEAEIDYLLGAVARLFPDSPPGKGEVLQHYCGVRPLPWSGDGATPAAITRRHMLVRHSGTPQPSWSIVGGKLTTCRSLAESAAAEILEALGRPVLATSAERPLPGRDEADGPREQESLAARLETAGLSAAASRRLLSLYGGLAASLLHASMTDVLGASGLPKAVVARAVTDEWALTLEDVVERRLMMSFDPKLDTTTLRAVAREMVACERLTEGAIDSEIDTLLRRWSDRYGRRVTPEPFAGENDR